MTLTNKCKYIQNKKKMSYVRKYNMGSILIKIPLVNTLIYNKLTKYLVLFRKV